MAGYMKPEDRALVGNVPGGVAIDRNNITLRFEQLAWLLDAARAESIVAPAPEPVKADTAAEGFDDEWPRALARLKNTEPHPDQGIACVGTRDLAMAIERLEQFANVALGNAVEIGRLTAMISASPPSAAEEA